MTQPFTYDALSRRVVFGPGASHDRLVDEVECLGAERVLLVVTERERELARPLELLLGVRVAAVFTRVQPHVPVAVAREALEVARGSRADAILTIGGGSTTGTAKAVALESDLPILAIPTTYAGSEMTLVWGTTSNERKTVGRSPNVLPKVVIYDPELTFSLPANVTAASAMNAVAHCVEAFYGPGANPITSLAADAGLRAIAQNVAGAVREPAGLEARTELLYGAYLAGSAFAVAGSGLHHRICHVLGGAYDLPHAETHSVILPQVTAFLMPALPETAALIAGAISADDAAQGLFDLARSVGSPTSLAEIGFPVDALDEAVALVLEEAPDHNPRLVDERAVRSILTGALVGTRPAPLAVAA